MSPVLLRDQTEGESPNAMYAIFRYCDRMFAERRTHRQEEIANLDVSLLSPRARYLIRHLLILQRRYVEMLNRYPNLRPLHDAVEIDSPIYLSEKPRYAHSYFTKKDILL